MKMLSDDKVLESYHDPKKNIVAFDLYEFFPHDIDDWAEKVIEDETSRNHFLEQVKRKQYWIELMVDKDTGNFEIALLNI